MRYFEDIVLNQPKHSRQVVLDKADTISFAKAWDPQPFHIDEQAAEDWPLGLTASGLHTVAIAIKLANEISKAHEPSAVVAGLGWDNIRFPVPVKPGDTVSCTTQVINKRESQSKPDLGITTSLIELFNQRDEKVLSLTTSTMLMKKTALPT